MINAFLVFNGQGQPRLTKFYTQLDTSIQQRLIAEIFALVASRAAGSCNFLPLPPLLASSGSSSGSGSDLSDRPSLVTYRHYATLYFIVISTATESPLALIDLIQVYVESLDRLFENVCELDLIFNFESMHATLGEMIVGGVVIETNLDRIVAGVRSQGAVAKRPVNSSTSGLGRGGGNGNSMSALGAALGTNFAWHGR
ncbi:ap-3 complex subunit sigma [Grosmannia clavigera kw1407]|uniref:AP complex subunit sigma n=1 Tax=Grosmannia clavigera (strain kw1407 / UAMH 11150) TaxID=655863 RepID=F0X6T8_GROCL|nr:ap-3 complex subunit sigma [Grosmannia clavigera kw1407]EFX06395.1 ap-3 complex subunit sigma [Grosmannia clavigera kw1407]